jgi:hypothetical protein
MYKCEVWFLVPQGKDTFESVYNKFLKRSFGPKRKEVTGGWENYMRSIVICLPNIIGEII